MSEGSTGKAVAALCSFILPGLGQLIQGRMPTACVHFVIFTVSWYLFASVITDPFSFLFALSLAGAINFISVVDVVLHKESMNKYGLFGIVFVLCTISDQITKLWVVYNIRGPVEPVKGISLLDKFGIDMETWRSLPTAIEVIPGFFDLVHTQNAGAAFGIMQGKMLVFALFTLIAMAVIIWTLVQMPDDDRFQNVALSLLASGTVGNGIDRMHKQSVTDFLHVYSEHPSVEPLLIDILGSNAWPSFNIADAAIVIGMIMFAVFYVFLEKDEEAEPDPPAEELSDITGEDDLNEEPTA